MRSSKKGSDLFKNKNNENKPATENQSENSQAPEIGNFKYLWKNYRDLCLHEENYDCEFRTVLGQIFLNLFGPGNFEDKKENVFSVGDKIEKLSQRSFEKDMEIALDMVDILDISCSVRSHPFWNINGNTSSHWKRKKGKFYLKWHTRLVLDWFSNDCKPKHASMPSHIRKAVCGCRETFTRIAGDIWRDRRELSFENWREFRTQKLLRKIPTSKPDGKKSSDGT
ncbi:hypothetical protein PISL3812_07729 [Talaromyces islandicus]|uniref:Uncharacterized protein n=1 Tax=Talaromyces islandicus TaxID=28573 RepID=A0A0U1M550_TALIS|nr:hypothetical protein PISL3812_07729 [Talaromyces islandicus]